MTRETCKKRTFLDGALHSRPFVQTDGGRALSKRPRQTNDCAVRALAAATGTPYDDAYDALKTAGRKSGRGTQEALLIEALNALGFGHLKHSFPAVKGQRRVNPVSFPATHPIGCYIVRTAKHYFAYVDGVAHDTSPSRADRCIYGALEIIRA